MVARGNGYTAPGCLILTHAGSERERKDWLRSIHMLDDQDQRTM
jgi:hypothetical protein